MQGVESCNMGCELSAWLNSFTPAPCTPPPVAEFEAPPVLSTQQQQQQQQQQQKKDRPKDRKDLPSDETSSSATEGNSGSTKAGRDKQQKTKDREEEEEDKGKGDAVWLRPQIVVSKKGRANDEYITKTTGRIAGEVSGLATTIGEQTALLEGVNRIYHEYRNQPHFGRADDVLPDLYKHKHEVRANHTRMQCCHAQLAVLEGISLQTALRRSIRRRSSRRTRTRAHARTHAHTHTRARAIAEENADDDDDDDEDDDDDDEGEESEDWDDDDDDDDGDHDDDHHDGGGGVETRVVDSPDLSSGAHVSAVVMFDYLGETKEHISVQSGDVVKLHECVDDGWWRVGHGDAVGLVPRSYLAAFVGNPRKLARTLYAYTAAAEGELSFEADRLIRVTKWNAAPGWTEGEYNGQRGVFPSSYIDRLHTA
ncbi:hypothetical protein PTSG_05221 [Salpingoeca rosetta]|uniref:SH3 domain-containing protein n=1 Tax=Salpingoeca rosetta (strain ATCC 50818 / BSB-021) TaxID=946362 RepID=F2UAV1_SALR5|nr:uncharacterized protein PTSG_05221 [Salpingoeca rosetta]EGD73517.1 hypothetical protein PTSG_05221 [Salpingoeca rosetta]|eukprot:XP_004993799.1 hypothetical protein PTSG_05221 [Salpingoeca rosetta]